MSMNKDSGPNLTPINPKIWRQAGYTPTRQSNVLRPARRPHPGRGLAADPVHWFARYAWWDTQRPPRPSAAATWWAWASNTGGFGSGPYVERVPARWCGDWLTR